MNKKIFAIIISIILAVSLIYIYIHFSNLSRFNNNSLIVSVPTNASLILRINNPQKIYDKINTEIKYKDALSSFIDVDLLIKKINEINKESKNIPLLKLLFTKPSIISFHQRGKNLKPLYVSSIENKIEQNNILEQLDKNKKNWRITTKRYNSTLIYNIKSAKIYCAFYKGIFISSTDVIQVENSLRQLNANYSLMNNTSFKPILKTIGHNCDANLFVNIKLLPLSLRNLFTKKDNVKKIGKLSNWTAFDINLYSNNIIVNGFMYSKNNSNNIQLLIDKIKPSSNSLNEIIPTSASLIFSYSLDDNEQIYKNFRRFLVVNNINTSFDESLRIIAPQKDIETIEKRTINTFDGEFALVNNGINKNNKGNNYLIIKTKSKSQVINMLEDFNKGEILLNKKYKVDEKTIFNIYESKAAKAYSKILTHYVGDVPDKYYTFFDNYLIFSDEVESLTDILYQNTLNKTIENNSYFKRFKENFSYKDNIFIYSNITNISNYVEGIKPKSILDFDENQKQELKNFFGIGTQISTSKNLLYCNICLNYMPNREQEPETIWQSGLGGKVLSKPALVKNHNNINEKEIVVQDSLNTLYLISSKGVILWQIKLDKPIKSEIFQVDYYKNNKLQYLFNTEDKLYLIDRNGNNVAKYPINLPFKATNGIALFDYNKNKEYRIFVACKNKQIYVFDKTGNKVMGWESLPTEGIVNQPLQFFRVKGKDYIVAADNKRNYIFNRKGSIRVKIKNDFVKNNNDKFYLNNDKLVCSDEYSNLRTIDLNTGETKSMTLLNEKVNHIFTAENIDKTPNKEYIIVDENILHVYNYKGEKLFDFKTKGNFSLNADIYNFSSTNKKIGLYDKSFSNIHLINNDGSEYKNFPLKGLSRFSIGFMVKNNKSFNLLVGGINNYLYNYRVER